MDILASSLSREIEAITKGGPTATNFYWDAEIHVRDQNYKPLKLISVDISRDYLNGFADEAIIRVMVGGGMYTYRLYPFLSEIEITLTKKPIFETDSFVNESQPVETERFTAILVDPFDPRLANNEVASPGEYELDLSNLLEIEFQLINKTVDQVRMRSFGANFRDETVEDIIKTVLSNESKLIVNDTEAIPVGVDMVPANNTTVRKHSIIPQGTRLVDLVKYMHLNCDGVYGAGCAAYFQKDMWYVFPPYDPSRFLKAARTATIINVPAKRMPAIERTFRLDGKNLVILATGETKTQNLSEKLIGNDGNGVRFGTADNFIENFAKRDGNKAIASRGGSNTEVINVTRPNGRNNVIQSSSRITSNALLQYSQLAARDGSLISMVWENSDPSLITPGMCVQVQFLESEEVREVEGVVIKADHYIALVGDGPAANRHRCQTALVIFAKRLVQFDE